MQTRCKDKHLQEDDRMELPESPTEPGAPGELKNAIIGEEILQFRSQYLAFFVKST